MPNLSQFKNHKEYIDWYRNYRVKNREKFRLYNKKYNKKWREDHDYIVDKNYIKNFPEKRKAQVKVRHAIKNGEVKRLPCEVCGEKVTHAHHDDYSKPLDVRFLCSVHHREFHREHRYEYPKYVAVHTLPPC